MDAAVPPQRDRKLFQNAILPPRDRVFYLPTEKVEDCRMLKVALSSKNVSDSKSRYISKRGVLNFGPKTSDFNSEKIPSKKNHTWHLKSGKCHVCHLNSIRSSVETKGGAIRSEGQLEAQ
jgi:hypothetical protein